MDSAITASARCGVHRLYATSLRVLANLTRVSRGLAFLGSRCKDIGEVAQHLLTKFEEEDAPERLIALQLIFKFCALRHLDQLLSIHREAKLQRDAALEKNPLLKGS